MKGGIKGVRELNGQTNISVTCINVGTSEQNGRITSIWIRRSSGRKPRETRLKISVSLVKEV